MKAAVEKEQAASASVERSWLWRKGESGNPAGRPKGSRNKATILGEMLLEQDVEALVRLAVKTALEGDKALLRFCLSRLFAPARHQRVAFDLPEPTGNPARDAAAAYDALLRAVAAGEIAPEEARVVMEIVKRARAAAEEAAEPAAKGARPATKPAAAAAAGRRWEAAPPASSRAALLAGAALPQAALAGFAAA
jgi:hypothetical protein